MTQQKQNKKTEAEGEETKKKGKHKKDALKTNIKTHTKWKRCDIQWNETTMSTIKHEITYTVTEWVQDSIDNKIVSKREHQSSK